MKAARSTNRFEYPHSLSYQPSTLTRLSVAMVSRAEKTHDDGLPTMSADTSGSSLYSSTPRDDESAEGSSNTALISSTDAGVESWAVRSVIEPVGVGTRSDVPSSLPL